MPLTPDTQPLVPPALKRIQTEPDLMCCEETLTAHSSLADYLSELDKITGLKSDSLTSQTSEESFAGACNSTDLSGQGESNQGHQVSKRVLLNQITPTKNERQARSTVTGLMSQFGQLHPRRPILNRLTVAVGNLFGRLCTRRRGLASSPEVEGEDTESHDIVGDRKAESKYISPSRANRDYSAVPLVEEDFLQQIEDDLCFGKVFDETRPKLCQTYSDIDLRSELESGRESGKVEVAQGIGSQEMSCEPCLRETYSTAEQPGKAISSPSHGSPSYKSAHRPRKRLTFHSPLSLLHLPKSKRNPTNSSSSTPQRKPNDDLDSEKCLENYKDAESKMKVELDLGMSTPVISQDMIRPKSDFTETESALL